ncbi:bet1-like protein At4g14600 [Euphorbia lathyris]|uniref:bet1-like protein At4g14600 n=1 Tax=Euphorbia lathyris TaxID=212925 RepID=UPI0033141C8C
MAVNSSRDGSFFGGGAPFRSREGLSTRSAAGSDEIQLRIDPMQTDFDDEISGLRSQVRQLRNVAQDIGSEAKFQKDFLDQLQMTMIRAQAGVKNNIRKLNKSIIKNGGNHVVHVVIFALICFFLVYLWSKVSRR